jgi:putative endonuclease
MTILHTSCYEGQVLRRVNSDRDGRANYYKEEKICVNRLRRVNCAKRSGPQIVVWGLRYATGGGYNVGMPEYYVYILASRKNGTLYVGMTEDIAKRTTRHKTGNGCKFTKDYEVSKLVYLEKCENRQTAMAREKQLKKYNRRWKIRIIEQLNPKWEDLFGKLIKTNKAGSPAENQGS